MQKQAAIEDRKSIGDRQTPIGTGCRTGSQASSVPAVEQAKEDDNADDRSSF
jgi:hypothetical protein